jgi:hypothetical protein
MPNDHIPPAAAAGAAHRGPVDAGVATARSCRMWTLYRQPSIARCELSATAGGCEVQMFLNHLMLISRLFPSPSEAVAYADAERSELMAQQWSPVDDQDE